MSFNFIDEQQATGRKIYAETTHVCRNKKLFKYFKSLKSMSILNIHPNEYTSLQVPITLFEYKIYVIIPVVN